MNNIEREKQLNDAIEILKKYGNEEDVEKAINNIKSAKQQMQENTEKVRKQISRGKILKEVIKNTRTYKLLVIFIAMFFALAGILYICEPGIDTYTDSLWLCFATATTIGFGDIVATTIIGRICILFLSIYSIVLTAIITSIIVAYHNQVLAVQKKESILDFFDKLERLPELSHEELVELSEMIKRSKDSTYLH